MRVVHCITGLTGDGAQRMLLRLAEQLQERGVENHVVSLSGPEPLADAFKARGIPVLALGLRHSLTDVWALRHMCQFLDAMRPDLLQGWMYHANAVLAVARPFLSRQVPVVWNIRRGMDDYAERKFSTRMFIHANRLMSARSQKIIYCTQESREQHESCGFASRDGMVLGNGFNTDIFEPSEEKRKLVRERYGVSDGQILIGNIGRDDIAKGRQFLFEAFSKLVKQFPNARLLLVGRGMNESNRRLRRTLVERQIAAHVVLVGEYSPVSDLYPAMDVLCSSSVSEGFPNVIAEGMSSGVACVATDTGNSRDLLEGTGVVVPSRSGLELAKGLAQLCAETVELRRARGFQARAKIVAGHSLSRVTDTYVSLYEGLLSRDGKVITLADRVHRDGVNAPQGAVREVGSGS